MFEYSVVKYFIFNYSSKAYSLHHKIKLSNSEVHSKNDIFGYVAWPITGIHWEVLNFTTEADGES